MTEVLNRKIIEKIKEIEMEEDVAKFIQAMLFFELKKFNSSNKLFTDKYKLEITKSAKKRYQDEK